MKNRDEAKTAALQLGGFFFCLTIFLIAVFSVICLGFRAAAVHPLLGLLVGGFGLSGVMGALGYFLGSKGMW